jgi:hypothetical protein
MGSCWLSSLFASLLTTWPSGGQSSLGGAIFCQDDGQTKTLVVLSCTFRRNLVVPDWRTGISILAAGGAINVAERRANATIVSSLFDGNRAQSLLFAQGGAVWSNAEHFMLANASVVWNEAVVNQSKSVALGGGLYHVGGNATMMGCRVAHNIARMVGGHPVEANGGGCWFGSGTLAVLSQCTMAQNSAGGRSIFVADPTMPQNVAALQNFYATAAAHIFSTGSLTLDQCEITDEMSKPLRRRSHPLPWQWQPNATVEHPAWWWIVLSGSTSSALLHSSVFTTNATYCTFDLAFASDCSNDGSASSEPNQPIGKLLHLTSGAEAVVRNCSLANLTIQNDGGQGTLGIVNSTISPPLNATSAKYQRNCGSMVAGRPLCDLRAECEAVASGGVLCSCAGEGLRFKPGVPKDGRYCEQDTSLRAVLESDSAIIDIAKPSKPGTRMLTLIAEARGEAELNVTFNVTMTRFEASSGRLIAANGSIRIDQPSMSAFGQHVEWKQHPPPATWHADLDAFRLKHAAKSRHDFTMRLACQPDERSCVADGDVITTVVQLAIANSQPSNLRSEVRVMTQVQSLLSCQHTRADVRSEPDSNSVGAHTAIRVQLFAKDVDDLPVSFNRAEIKVLFDGRDIPLQWSRGSNKYFAEVPAELTEQPGVYELLVNASNAWEETGSCELLRRTVTVESDRTQLIIAGVIISGLILVLATLMWFLFKNKDKAKELLASFVSSEGMLTLDIGLEIW